jgi:hypothetical protein
MQCSCRTCPPVADAFPARSPAHIHSPVDATLPLVVRLVRQTLRAPPVSPLCVALSCLYYRRALPCCVDVDTHTTPHHTTPHTDDPVPSAQLSIHSTSLLESPLLQLRYTPPQLHPQSTNQTIPNQAIPNESNTHHMHLHHQLEHATHLPPTHLASSIPIPLLLPLAPPHLPHFTPPRLVPLHTASFQHRNPSQPTRPPRRPRRLCSICSDFTPTLHLVPCTYLAPCPLSLPSPFPISHFLFLYIAKPPRTGQERTGQDRTGQGERQRGHGT